jgi:hypothetical protein
MPLIARPALARVTLVGILRGGLRPACRLLLAGLGRPAFSGQLN